MGRRFANNAVSMFPFIHCPMDLYLCDDGRGRVVRPGTYLPKMSFVYPLLLLKRASVYVCGVAVRATLTYVLVVRHPIYQRLPLQVNVRRPRFLVPFVANLRVRFWERYSRCVIVGVIQFQLGGYFYDGRELRTFNRPLYWFYVTAFLDGPRSSRPNTGIQVDGLDA